MSFDLIYARQNQSLANWKAELTRALDMAVDHISLYQLTIEDGTAFGDRYAHGKLRGLPKDDTAADMYDMTQDICGAAGLLSYEVSNHAKPGSESRHNLVYWRYGDYVGVGPGAHGRITQGTNKYATEALKQPGAWLNAIEAPNRKADTNDLLSLPEQAAEFLMMGLRLTEGISVRRYNAMADAPLDERKIGELETLGMVEQRQNRLFVTPKGRPILNEVLRQLLV